MTAGSLSEIVLNAGRVRFRLPPATAQDLLYTTFPQRSGNGFATAIDYDYSTGDMILKYYDITLPEGAGVVFYFLDGEVTRRIPFEVRHVELP